MLVFMKLIEIIFMEEAQFLMHISSYHIFVLILKKKGCDG